MSVASGAGVFLGAGWFLRMPEIVFRLDDQGDVQTDPIVPEVLVELWPEWLTIADEALQRGEAARVELERSVLAGRGEDTRRALLAELRAGMLVMAATAAAWEGIHDSLIRRLRTRPDFGDRTGTKRRVVEVVRRAFKINHEEFGPFRKHVGEVFELRNLAVHPQSKYERPYTHAPANTSVPLVFIRFRLENQRTVVGSTRPALKALFAMPRHSEPQVAKWAAHHLRHVFGVDPVQEPI